MSPISALLTLGLTAVIGVFGSVGSAKAIAFSQLDFTEGSTSYDGRFSRVVDRLLDRDGEIRLGQYQPTPDIVSPISKGHRTFSLFTSGLAGASAPSVNINASSISVDLSSLYFGFTRGGEIRGWNIGGVATGLYDPQTSEFFVSWNHVFDEGSSLWKHESTKERAATFFLHGKADGMTSPVPLSGSVMFFMTGILMIAGLFWRNSGASMVGTAS